MDNNCCRGLDDEFHAGGGNVWWNDRGKLSGKVAKISEGLKV
jgi:hypothetical protein